MGQAEAHNGGARPTIMTSILSGMSMDHQIQRDAGNEGAHRTERPRREHAAIRPAVPLVEHICPGERP